jgi:hypothetical protein
VIKKMTNRAYKYQYGDNGWKNNVSNKPPVLPLIELENPVFKNHVAKENVKYGTPRFSAFFNALLLQLLISSTLLNF